MEGVSVEKVAKKLQLNSYMDHMDLKKFRIKLPDVNRPALQLSGYFEHFEQSRVQIIYVFRALGAERERRDLPSVPALRYSLCHFLP